MNKGIYRLVWNSSLGALQVVGEAARSRRCGGSGSRVTRARGSALAWPLALLSLGVASSLYAAPGVVSNGADSGQGSLREAAGTLGTTPILIEPWVDTITLDHEISIGSVKMIANGPLSITGPGLKGTGADLTLFTSSGELSTTITGQFTGTSGSPGTSSDGLSAAPETANNGSNAFSSVAINGGTAVQGNLFALTNNASVVGGAGGAAQVPATGGAGGSGASFPGGSGTSGGNGGSGTSGHVGAHGGNGVSAGNSRIINGGLIMGGRGADGAVGGSGGLGGVGGALAQGGNGGKGGNGGAGGNGGTGISGGQLQIVNTGVIAGGNGGNAGAGGAGGAGGQGGPGGGPEGMNGADGAAGRAGVGGVAINLTGNSSVFNSGTIEGGVGNGGNGARAVAIKLEGGRNTLTLAAGSVIHGNVVSGGDDSLVLGGDVTAATNIFDLASLSVVFMHQDSTLPQFQGFNSLTKKGASTWTLTGSDKYGKPWTVEAGTLVMANKSSLSDSVAISRGANLVVHGASIGVHVYNNGLLTVDGSGSPSATLTVGGSYRQDTDATLRLGVTSASDYSQLHVGGNVTLDGTLDIDVKNRNTLAGGNRLIDIITAGGSVNGQFAQVTDNSLLFSFTPTYNANSVDLNVVADNGGSNGGNGNTVLGNVTAQGNLQARGAAAVLDRVFANNPSGQLASHFIPLSTQDEVSAAASEVLPMVGGSTQAALTALTGINGVVQARSDSIRGLSTGDSVMTDSTLWIKPFGTWADQESGHGVAGMRSNVGGMAFGLDGSNEQWVLGSAFVYANADTRTSGGAAKQKLSTDVYQLVGYGTYRLDERTGLSFQLDVGQNRNDGTRDIGFAGLQAKSDYDSWTAHAGVALDRTFSLDTATRFTPSVRADYTWIKDDAYREKGADALNLEAKKRTTDQFILGLDGKLVHDLTEKVSVSGNLGVGYDFLANRDAISTSFAGAPGAAFTTYGAEAQRWLVRGGTGLSYQVNGQLELAVRYDLEQRTRYLSQTASAEARWAF